MTKVPIPAVVAMQYSILDNTAKLFADEFYRTLALGFPVDKAIQTTRNAISMEVGLDKRDFATPVLYMGAKDGIILNVMEKELLEQPLAPVARSQNQKSIINSTFMESLEYPDGAVPLDSAFYLERNGIESVCYQTLEKPAALIRIKAPKLMGKTSLARQIVAQGGNLNYQGVYLDLGGVNKEVITNLDKFLRWLCCKVSSASLTSSTIVEFND